MVKTTFKRKKSQLAPSDAVPAVILERLGFLLNQSGQRIREMMAESLEPFGLTGKHLGILLLIQDKGSLGQHEIGKCVNVDRTTMVQFIDDLEKMGLVERKDNPVDRRAYALVLTGKGREVLPKAHHLGLKTEREFLSCLTSKDQKELYRILKQLLLAHFSPSNE